MDESDPIDPAPGQKPVGDAAGVEEGTQYVRSAEQATIPPRRASSAPSLPEQFGRYRIRQCLGQGAMGSVYLADDTQLDRPIALKIPKLSPDEDAELAERFYREARAAATLRHPNLCPIYDAGEIDGVPYLSMAFIDGRPLCDALAEVGAMAPRDAAALVLKLAKALEAAHARGVVHRDLKPANIMIDGQNEPIIMDFGLARRMDRQDSRLTQSGLLMGSPAYMSPEQVEGDIEKMGPCCDVYSLGIVLYELLTGQVPFRGSTAAVIGQIITSAPRQPSLVRPGIDPALESICLKMIAKRVEDRLASMHDVVVALEAFLAGRPISSLDGARVPLPAHPPIGFAQLETRAPRGVLLAPWMVWTAVGVVVLGFGVTWKLIAVALQQRSGGEEVVLSSPAREAIDSGAVKVRLGGTELTKAQLRTPLELPSGPNKIKVEEGGAVTTRDVVSDRENPSFLNVAGNRIAFDTLRQQIARRVIESGGKVNTGDGLVDKVESLPAGSSYKIEAIDLSGAKSVDDALLTDIERLGATLKRLVLSGANVRPDRLRSLQTALPGCEIKT